MTPSNETQTAHIAGATVVGRPRRGGANGLTFLQNHAVAIMTLILVIGVTLANPNFLSYLNLANMLSQWAPAGLMAVGMTFVVIAGGFDLSIAAIFSLSSVVAAIAAEAMGVPVALVAALLVGGLVGAVNASLIARLDINPFITTVGTGFIVTGVTFVVTGNAAFFVSAPGFGVLGAGRLMGFPYSGMLLIAVLILSAVILHKSVFGHQVFAVGGNPEASRLSGLNVPLVIGSTYALLGALAGLAGLISASQLSSAQAVMDPNILFDVLTIVIVGGTPLGGGIGSIWRTCVGLILIATISNGFVLLDISPSYQNIIKGCLIVGALALDSLLKRLR